MSNLVRQEKDLLGPCDIPADALWGVHTRRAIENFPLAGRPVNRELVHAYGAVKLAAAQTNHELGRWDDATFAAIETACREMIDGRLDQHVVVDALQGGAGTSTNMNVNEVLANRALQILGRPPGDYQTLSPLDDLNLHQSTNDTYPTALRVAAIYGLRRLEPKIVALQEAFQEKEKQFAHIVKIPRWLQQYVGGHLSFQTTQGHDFPADLSSYQLVVHCGAWMWNRREVLTRMLRCRQAGVPICSSLASQPGQRIIGGLLSSGA